MQISICNMWRFKIYSICRFWDFEFTSLNSLPKFLILNDDYIIISFVFDIFANLLLVYLKTNTPENECLSINLQDEAETKKGIKYQFNDKF